MKTGENEAIDYESYSSKYCILFAIYRNSVKQRKNDGILHEGQNNIYIHLVLFVRIFPSVETTT